MSQASAFAKGLRMTGQSDQPSIPVFVISYNRGQMMEQVIASYQAQTIPVEIIIHDNGSDDPITIDVLASLEACGVTVFRNPPIATADDLNLVNETVTAYFAANGPNRNYVVTDCDIDMGIAGPEALAVYLELLAQFPKARCVGPMLRIRDIPRDYPLFHHVMNRHIKQFWRHVPTQAETSHGTVFFQNARIDTTFAVHRAGQPFTRLKPGLRVYEPYEAKHLDWYKTEEVSDYHTNSNAQISHWDNIKEFEKYRDAKQRFKRFKSVEPDPNGVVRVIDRRV
jgi:glycosyltransferase involved in cell wall biosynthesis